MKKEEIQEQKTQQGEKALQEEKNPREKDSPKKEDSTQEGKSPEEKDNQKEEGCPKEESCPKDNDSLPEETSDQSDKSDLSDSSDNKNQELAFPKEMPLDDNDRQAVVKIIKGIATELKTGVLSQATINNMLHALHHDRDVAAAAHEGEIKGRNTRIEEYLIQRKKAASIHQPSSTAHTLSPTLPYNRIGGLSAADRQTIWERGNEKRVRY